jgi:hypothetical protein
LSITLFGNFLEEAAQQQNAHEQRAAGSHMAKRFRRCHVILSVSIA